VEDLIHSPKNEEEEDLGLTMFLNTKCNADDELIASILIITSPMILKLSDK